MSRVLELHQDWMKDPAFVQEFKKLEEELKQLKTMAPSRGTATATGRNAGGASSAEVGRKRSA